MEGLNDIPNWIIKSEKPIVPVGFFDHFPKKLSYVLGCESDDLFAQKSHQKRSVPEGFFETFPNKLMARIADEGVTLYEFPILSKLKLAAKPAVPAGYFNSLTSPFIQSEQKKGRIISIRLWYSLAGAAAALLLFFLIYNPTEPVVSDDVTMASSQADANQDELLTYLNDDEIIDYIIENDISLEGEDGSDDDDALYEFTSDDVEEYYFD